MAPRWILLISDPKVLHKRFQFMDNYGSSTSAGLRLIPVFFLVGTLTILCSVLCCCICAAKRKEKREQRCMQRRDQDAGLNSAADSHIREQEGRSTGGEPGSRNWRIVGCFSRSRSTQLTNDVTMGNESSSRRISGWFSKWSSTTTNNDVEMSRFRRGLSRVRSIGKPTTQTLSNLPQPSTNPPSQPVTPSIPVHSEPSPTYQPPLLAASDAWSLRSGTPPPLYPEREWDVLHEEEVEGVRTQGVQYDRPVPEYTMANRMNGTTDLS